MLAGPGMPLTSCVRANPRRGTGARQYPRPSIRAEDRIRYESDVAPIETTGHFTRRVDTVTETDLILQILDDEDNDLMEWDIGELHGRQGVAATPRSAGREGNPVFQWPSDPGHACGVFAIRHALYPVKITYAALKLLVSAKYAVDKAADSAKFDNLDTLPERVKAETEQWVGKNEKQSRLEFASISTVAQLLGHNVVDLAFCEGRTIDATTTWAELRGVLAQEEVTSPVAPDPVTAGAEQSARGEGFQTYDVVLFHVNVAGRAGGELQVRLEGHVVCAIRDPATSTTRAMWRYQDSMVDAYCRIWEGLPVIPSIRAFERTMDVSNNNEERWIEGIRQVMLIQRKIEDGYGEQYDEELEDAD